MTEVGSIACIATVVVRGPACCGISDRTYGAASLPVNVLLLFASGQNPFVKTGSARQQALSRAACPKRMIDTATEQKPSRSLSQLE